MKRIFTSLMLTITVCGVAQSQPQLQKANNHQKEEVLTANPKADIEAVPLAETPAEAAKIAKAAFDDSTLLSVLSKEVTVGDTVNYGVLYLQPRARVDSINVQYKRKNDTIKRKNDTNWVYAKAKLNRVEIRIEGFHIARCMVYTSRGLFQSRYPISLLYYNQSLFKGRSPRKTDRLFLQSSGGCDWRLEIGDVLGFDPSARHRVSLSDYDIRLQTDTPHHASVLKAIPVADNIINFSIFTDVAGLFGAANGLVQFEADALIPIMHTNAGNSNLFWLRSFRPYFNLARLDKEFQVVDVRHELDDRHINDTTFPNLYRQAFMRGGLEFNMINCVAGTNNSSFFIGGEFRQTRILLRDNDTRSANIISGYLGASFFTRALDNFRIGADVRWYPLCRLIQTLDYEREYMTWLNSGVQISYHPPSRPDTKIFLRLNYNHYLSAPGSDFVQVQVGYKTPLSKKVKMAE